MELGKDHGLPLWGGLKNRCELLFGGHVSLVDDNHIGPFHLGRLTVVGDQGLKARQQLQLSVSPSRVSSKQASRQPPCLLCQELPYVLNLHLPCALLGMGRVFPRSVGGHGAQQSWNIPAWVVSLVLVVMLLSPDLPLGPALGSVGVETAKRAK